MATLIGIDPGASGGVAIVRDGMFRGGIRMPTMKQKTRTIVDAFQLGQWLDDQTEDWTAFVIEQVSAMPRQGVASSFNFGRAAGAVEAWALSYGLPVHWHTPAKWKPAMGLSKDKGASMDLAAQLYGRNPLWEVKANDGIAEAALLATYHHQKFS